MSIGTKIDKLSALRKRRQIAAKKVAELKGQEAILADEIIADLREQKLKKGAGKKASFSFNKKPVGKVNDWEAFYKFIKRNNAFELLERRVAQGPYRERLDDKKRKTPDGVATEHVTGYTLTDARG